MTGDLVYRGSEEAKVSGLVYFGGSQRTVPDPTMVCPNPNCIDGLEWWGKYDYDGRRLDEWPCPICNGSGRVPRCIYHVTEQGGRQVIEEVTPEPQRYDVVSRGDIHFDTPFRFCFPQPGDTHVWVTDGDCKVRFLDHEPWVNGSFLAALQVGSVVILGDRVRLDTPITRMKCPDCKGVGRHYGSVPGVPMNVCTKSSPCRTCWPDGKFWRDETVGSVPLSVPPGWSEQELER